MGAAMPAAGIKVMDSRKQVMTNCKVWFRGENAFALGLGAAAAFFVGWGIHRFWLGPGHFGIVSFLGCVAAAFGAFFLLLITDYVLHHARLVFIPWFIGLIYFALTQPHFAVGLGLALGFLVVSQMRN